MRAEAGLQRADLSETLPPEALRDLPGRETRGWTLREALRYLQTHSALRYSLRPLSPDYYPDLPGATHSGRALEIDEYDGRCLGEHFKHLRRPPDGMLLFGLTTAFLFAMIQRVWPTVRR